MRKFHLLAATAALACAGSAFAQSVVIEEVYGGGGNAGSTWRNDFIVLRNRTALPINLTGWSIQYASAAGIVWQVTNLSGSVPANGFYLVQEAQGAGGTQNLPTPDAIGTISMSATAGKVALSNSTTAFNVGCPTGGSVVDFVGFGATPNCFEGSGPTPAPSATTSVIRALDGCTDSNNNAADFTAGTPNPRNTASPAGAECTGGITDCNGNGIDDTQDIISGFSQDCNHNNIPDECDIANGAPDFNGNGVPDSCESNVNQIIISEVVDGPMGGSLPKFTEITNIGAAPVTFGPDDFLRVYANGAMIATYNFSLANVVLAPGASYTVANEGTGGSGAVNWLTVYGVFNPPSAYGSASFINGDDAITFERNNVIVDAFGRIGEGAGGPGTIDWGYSDGYANRRPNVCSPTGSFDLAQWVIGGNNSLEAPTPDAAPEPTNWFNNVRGLTSPNSHANVCNSRVNDCNANGIDDTADIANGAPDCNQNGVPDSCDIAHGLADCNANGIPDNCEVAAGAVPDINHNGIPDGCESVLFDCNNNGVEDATDIQNGTSQDCDGNGVPDECQIGQQAFTDVDANSQSDACEGAAVVLTSVNGTIQPNGARAPTNGDAFFNVEGAANGNNASYGGTRFSVASIASVFDNAFGSGNWTVSRIYYQTIQSNAAFTHDGATVYWWTNNDSIDFTPGNTSTRYPNFATDYPDRLVIANPTFTQVANGDVDAVLLYDASGSNSAGATALAGEIQSGAGEATIVISEDFDNDPGSALAATWAGRINNTYRGPTLVVFATQGGGPNCPWNAPGSSNCVADYNGSGGTPDDADVSAFFSAWNNGDECADANQSGGTPDDADISTFFQLWNNGGC